MIDLGFEEVVNAILDAIPTSNLKSDDEALALQQVRLIQSLSLPLKRTQKTYFRFSSSIFLLQEMQAKAGHRLYRLTQMFSATMPPALERLAR